MAKKAKQPAKKAQTKGKVTSASTEEFPYVVTVKTVVGEIRRLKALHAGVQAILHPVNEQRGKGEIDILLKALESAEKALLRGDKNCPNGMQRIVLIQRSELDKLGKYLD